MLPEEAGAPPSAARGINTISSTNTAQAISVFFIPSVSGKGRIFLSPFVAVSILSVAFTPLAAPVLFPKIKEVLLHFT